MYWRRMINDGANALERRNYNMLKKITIIVLCLTGINMGYSDPQPLAKETIKEWHGANSNGRVGLHLGDNSFTGLGGATITFVCSSIQIREWKTDGSEMTGEEHGGPLVRGPGTEVKVTAKNTRHGIKLSIDGDGTWYLEPGAGLLGPVCL